MAGASAVQQLLQASLSPDAATRDPAVARLESLASESFSGLISALAEVLGASSADASIRIAAAISAKNAIAPSARAQQDALAARWLGLDGSVRAGVQHSAIEALADSSRPVRNAAAQLVAAIASVELPHGGSADLIERLRAAASDSRPELRAAALVAIGYLLEQVKPTVIAASSNAILTAIVSGIKDSVVDVSHAAVTALYNALPAVSANMQREGERNYLMTVLCEATQSPSPAVQAGAFACLVACIEHYYDKMRNYLERAIFGLTIMGMRSEHEPVALQAVEIWSTIADIEIDIALESEELEGFEEPERQSQHFARIGLRDALPVLLELLMKQDEDATEDEWNVAMAAGTCLGLFAQAVGDAIVTPIIPYIEANIRSADWHHREAAVLAFGSILDGPEPRILTPLVTQALPTLIEMVRDPSEHVKDTSAWTLGRISDLHVGIINHERDLPAMISALVTGLGDGQRVASNCCWALMNLAEQLGDATAASCPLSPYYEGIVQALLAYAERGELTARTSSYETCSALVSNAPADCLRIVSELSLSALARAEAALGMHNQIVGSDERNVYNELQMNLCGLLTAVVRRLGHDAQSLADRIMTLLLQLIQTSGKQSPVLEDAFLCVGALASALDSDFRPYIEVFLPFLHSALQSHAEYQLYSIAVGLIGDICRALGESAAAFCQPFMEALLAGLQSAELHRSAKPPILSCFGDIAMAIGGSFEPYVGVTVGVLQQASAMRAESSNFDMIDYVNQLREGVLEAFTGIVAAMKTGGKAATLLPAAPTIISVLHLCLTDQNRTDAIVRAAIGLLGDLADTFPDGALRGQLASDWVDQALRVARSKTGASASSAETRKLVKWATAAVKKATQ